MYFSIRPCELPKRESPQVECRTHHLRTQYIVHVGHRVDLQLGRFAGEPNGAPDTPVRAAGFDIQKIDIHPSKRDGTAIWSQRSPSPRDTPPSGRGAHGATSPHRPSPKYGSRAGAGAAFFFRGIKHGIERRIVIHLHLFVGLHVFTSGFNILDQLLDRSRKINLLRQQHIEFLLAGSAMRLVHILAEHLLTHVVNLQGQDRGGRWPRPGFRY